MRSAAEGRLRGRRILVAEDEYHIAEEIAQTLTDAGAKVLGPVSTVTQAQALAAGEGRIDGALLDVNLSGRMVWPALDALLRRNIPAVLTTGYDGNSIPAGYANLPRCEKPVTMHELTDALLQALSP